MIDNVKTLTAILVKKLGGVAEITKEDFDSWLDEEEKGARCLADQTTEEGKPLVLRIVTKTS